MIECSPQDGRAPSSYSIFVKKESLLTDNDDQEGMIIETASEAPFAISLWGGIGIALGLIFYGKKVIV